MPIRPIDPKYAEAERVHIGAERAAGKADLQITSEMLAGWVMAMAEAVMANRVLTFDHLLQESQHIMGTLAELGWTHPEMTLEGRE